jgi:hypothetical protein
MRFQNLTACTVARPAPFFVSGRISVKTTILPPGRQ